MGPQRAHKQGGHLVGRSDDGRKRNAARKQGVHDPLDVPVGDPSRDRVGDDHIKMRSDHAVPEPRARPLRRPSGLFGSVQPAFEDGLEFVRIKEREQRIDRAVRIPKPVVRAKVAGVNSPVIGAVMDQVA